MRGWIYSLGVFVTSLSFADVLSIHSIKEMKSHAEGKENVLVVFDIDDTLTILSDPAFHSTNFKIHHASVFKEIMSPLNPRERHLAFTIPLLTTASDLIEIETSQVIDELQNRGVKTIALTAAMGGEIEGVSIEDRRIKELNRVGIDFSRSFPDISEMIFSGFNAPINGRGPFFKLGVILANENDKGEVLVAFLQKIEWKPDLILFVDDRIEHVHAVQKAIGEFYPEIECKGFHYNTDHVPYAKLESEQFSKQWVDLAEKAKELLQNESGG